MLKGAASRNNSILGLVMTCTRFGEKRIGGGVEGERGD